MCFYIYFFFIIIKLLNFFLQCNELLVYLPDSKRTPQLEAALKDIVSKLLEVPITEINCSVMQTESLPLSNSQLQVALLSLSERLVGAASTYETIIQEVAADNDNWISNIGFNAVSNTLQNYAIDIRTDIAFTNLSQMFDTDQYSEKLALCLNVADSLSEQVKSTIHFFNESQN